MKLVPSKKALGHQKVLEYRKKPIIWWCFVFLKLHWGTDFMVRFLRNDLSLGLFSFDKGMSALRNASRKSKQYSCWSIVFWMLDKNSESKLYDFTLAEFFALFLCAPLVGPDHSLLNIHIHYTVYREYGTGMNCIYSEYILY